MSMLGWLTGSVIEKFTDPLLRAYEMRMAAQNDSDRLTAERSIASLEAARDIALAESHDRWSATRLGRFLIVIPYGLWWAAVYLVQMINPWLAEPIFGTTLTVYDVPPHINEMAKFLVPAIVIGDAGVFAAKKMNRR